MGINGENGEKTLKQFGSLTGHSLAENLKTLKDAKESNTWTRSAEQNQKIRKSDRLSN